MSASALTTPSPDAATGCTPATARDSAAEIDASCRWPVLLLLISAVKWLTLGTAVGVLAAIKFHSPGFLADYAWLTYGRVRPAAMNMLWYGFAAQAGLAAGVWMVCRLGAVRLLFGAPLIVGGVLWNLGLLLGVLGVLAGDSTGFEWLELPRYASPMLFLAFVIMALGVLINAHHRRERTLYVSQWYLLAGLFSFAWAYPAANYLLVFDPVRGVFQAVVGAWYGNSFLGLWLTPLGLAVIFYLVPKLAERPLHNYALAVFGFWSLIVIANWAALAPLTGGPVPRWMPAVGVGASLLLVVPILAVGLNWWQTLRGAMGKAREDLALRFVLAGAACYLLASLATVVLNLPPVSRLVQFTLAPVGCQQLMLHGFLGMTFLAVLYHMMPRLTGVEWPAPQLIRLHFWLTIVGVGLIFLALTAGGIVQGPRLRDPNVDFVRIGRGMIPFAGNATFGLVILLAGQAVLGWHLVLLFRQYCRMRCPVCEWLGCCAAAAEGRDA